MISLLLNPESHSFYGLQRLRYFHNQFSVGFLRDFNKYGTFINIFYNPDDPFFRLNLIVYFSFFQDISPFVIFNLQNKSYKFNH